MRPPDAYDIAIIGGGVNGCGIAADAAGRGLTVLLAEKGDLGGATSSADGTQSDLVTIASSAICSVPPT